MGGLQPEILQDFEDPPSSQASHHRDHPFKHYSHRAAAHESWAVRTEFHPKKGSLHILTAVVVKRRGKGRFVLNRHM